MSLAPNASSIAAWKISTLTSRGPKSSRPLWIRRLNPGRFAVVLQTQLIEPEKWNGITPTLQHGRCGSHKLPAESLCGVQVSAFVRAQLDAE
jgi:hypothetical protein